MRTSKRTLVAGLMAVAFLVAPAGLSVTTGGTGPGLSLMPTVSTAYAVGTQQTTGAPSSGTTATAPRTNGTGTTNPHPVVTGGSAVYAQAGSTGDGPADQAECDRWAGEMNAIVGILKGHMDAGNEPGISDAVDALEATEDVAMDRGCFIVY